MAGRKVVIGPMTIKDSIVHELALANLVSVIEGVGMDSAKAYVQAKANAGDMKKVELELIPQEDFDLESVHNLIPAKTITFKIV